MSHYLREQTTGEIVRNSLQLYRQNFRTVLVFVRLFLPILAVQHLLLATSVSVLAIESLLVLLLSLLLVQPVAIAIFSVLLWDVCVGNRPSVSLAVSRVRRGRVLARVLGVSLLTLLAPLLAFVSVLVVSLVFPMLVVIAWFPMLVIAWFMFAVPVTVLEELPVAEALRRSKALGKGYYARNFGISFGFLAVVSAISVSAPIPFYFLLPEDHVRWVTSLVGLLFNSLLHPLIDISIILIYFDMRARKEAYSLFMMKQDLTR